jgi:thiamine biosynthesis lipoprotein
LAALAAQAPAAGAELGRWSGEHVLGTSFDLKLRGGSDVAASVAAHAALEEAARLDRVLSTWRDDSEISRLHRERSIVASPDLFEMLALCDVWRTHTQGAFDAVRADSGGGACMRLDRRSRTVALADGAWLDIDAIAKGYVIDHAFAAARRAAPQASALPLNIGGDMRAWTAPHAEPWRIAIADPARPFDNGAPLQTIELRTGALAVSGRGHRSARAPIRDPRNGSVVDNIALAAAAARTAAAADALATSLAVLGAENGPTLFGEASNTGGLLAQVDGTTFTLGAWRGEGAGVCQAAWPEGRALTVSIEIPARGDANYERPYVAVWITDEARNLVRTLLVLGPQARWRESNYIFWRRVERMDATRIAGAARPTREPGRYDVIWDGRTETGAVAPQGRYILNIEASREHGGHNFVSVPLDLTADGFDLSADANQELGQTRIRYGRRS